MINIKLRMTTDNIYDTLMQNLQHEQFNINKVTEQEVDSNVGIIKFIYEKKKYVLTLKAIN